MQPPFKPRDGAATSDATGVNNDATQDANGATVWLSVAEVARLEGVSVRAVQRRCQSAKYRSRRVQLPQGERLEVDAATLATPERDGRDVEAQTRRDASDVPATPTAKDAAPDFAARYVEHLESENGFLRRALEQRDRDAAELRAALREALKVQPRQLEAPGTASERAQIAAPPKDTPDAQTPVKSPQNAPPTKEPRPLWKLLLGVRLRARSTSITALVAINGEHSRARSHLIVCRELTARRAGCVHPFKAKTRNFRYTRARSHRAPEGQRQRREELKNTPLFYHSAYTRARSHRLLKAVSMGVPTNKNQKATRSKCL